MKPILFALTLLTVSLAAHAQSWTNRFNGSANGDDTAVAIVVDSSGNVVVTGQSDSGGGTNIASVTIKYSSAGVPLWTNRYDGPGGWDWSTALAVDDAGDVIVTGTSAMDPGYANSDCTTIKYLSAGLPLWTNRYDLAQLDMPTSIAADSAGNVIITGFSTGMPGGYDFLTVKYSSGGVPQWTNHYGGGVEWASFYVVVDQSDNVVVSGTSYGINGGDYGDYTTIKYSGNGEPLWTNLYGATTISTDRIAGVALDTNGNVFVTGHAVESDFDWVTVAYSSAGVPLWTNRFNGSANGDDAPAGVAVDREGNVIVAGYSWTGSSFDYLTIKYSGAGVPLWTNRYDGTANGYDSATAIAVDASGNVFVTGQSAAGNDKSDYVTIKYSGAGIPLSTNRYNGPGNGDDSAKAITVDGSGNVFVTGSSLGSGSGLDFATVKYAAPPPPALDIQRLANSVVLSWTNAAFGLQSAPSLTGTFTNIPGAFSPYTSPISGGQAFFRLWASAGCSSGISGLLAQEPFDYAAGSALDTLNGGTGFSGPWSSTLGGPNYLIAGGSLTFSPLCIRGGRLNSAPGPGLTQIARTLASNFGADGSTRYFSFLLRPEGVLNGGDFGGFFGLQLQGGPGLFIGKTGGGALESYVLEDVGGARQVASSVNAVVGETVLLVVKAEFAAGNDTFTLYVNPAPGSPEPATGTVKSDLDLDTSNSLLIYSSGEFSLDELRFGETFESVTPQ